MAALVAIGTSATLGATAAAVVPAPASGATPTISLDLPSQIGNGGDLQDGSATIDNSAGGDVPTARVDFDITPTGDTAALAPEDIVVQYFDPADSSYHPIPLTADASGGGVHGFYGPAAGFDIPAGATATTPLKVTTNPSAPTGPIRVSANLDTTPGDTSTSLSTANKNITLSTPTISFDDYPTQLPAGGDYQDYTGTLDNSTGSNYGGSAPSNTPSPAGVRVDYDIASNKTISAADLSVEYCLNGTADAACTGGTWTDLPLSDSSGHVVGDFGPQGGFALPNGANNVTEFRVKALAGTPASRLTTTVSLDKVDPATGSTSGTDSSGVANGTITSTQVTTDVTEPTLTLDLPDSIGIGGDLKSASATIDNTGGPAISGVRVDLEITPDPGTGALSPNDFVIKLDTGGIGTGPYVDVPLTADASGGGLHGYAPPSSGFTIDADNTDISHLKVGANPSAPHGGVTLTASLDTTPGDPSTAIATASHHTAIAAPSFEFPDYPASITAGGGFTTFTELIHNATGSDYGGSSADSAPSPAGLVVNLAFASDDASLSTSQVLLQSCNGGSDSSCTGGTWTTIPLSGTGTLTGTDRPTGGFALPAGATKTTYFRIAVNRAVPGGTTITPTLTLTKVNPDGSATGTDSGGVANGAIVAAHPGAISMSPFVRPKITATKSSAHPKTRYGWYRSRVTVTFHCRPGSAGGLRQPCPSPVVFRTNGFHETTRTITSTNGVTASVRVRVKIDHSKPHVKVSGVKKGHIYRHRHALHALCSDGLSGVATCRIHQHRFGHREYFTATAKDKAGNKTTVRGSYRIRRRG